MAAPTQHPAYRGLFDYDALKGRSNDTYDAADAALRAGDGGGGYNATMNIIANSQNKQSPWAPYFQNLQEQGVSKVSQDAARPHGFADIPGFWQQGDAGALAHDPWASADPLMTSSNIATPMQGLKKAGR